MLSTIFGGEPGEGLDGDLEDMGRTRMRIGGHAIRCEAFEKKKETVGKGRRSGCVVGGASSVQARKNGDEVRLVGWLKTRMCRLPPGKTRWRTNNPAFF